MKRLSEFMEEHFGSSWRLSLGVLLLMILIATVAIVTASAVYDELIDPWLEGLTPTLASR